MYECALPCLLASFLYCKPQRPLEVTYIWHTMKYILLLLFRPYSLGKLKKVVKSCTVEMSIWAADDIEVIHAYILLLTIVVIS